ncbi:MAG: Hpt domain-containing protein [Thermodesulfobacteriota bacterium]|nr:Hpt domain-containing protein [Thermodesulfobacteriota bacterium]
MDLNQMAENLDMTRADFLKMAFLLVSTSQKDVSEIEAGLTSKKTDQVAAAAHSIKGAAGTLGFTALSQKAFELEQAARTGRLSGLEGVKNEIKAQIEMITRAVA